MSGGIDPPLTRLFNDPISKVKFSPCVCRPYQVGVYSAALRRRVFAEHLGFLPDDYDPDNYDPLTHPSCESLVDVASDSFYKDIWLKRASINTTVYDKVTYIYLI